MNLEPDTENKKIYTTKKEKINNIGREWMSSIF